MIGTHLPSALRSFLLTLAVVDDLVAITIIAIFYTQTLDLTLLALALVPLAVFAGLVQRRVRTGGSCSPWPPSPGASCTPPASTPPSPGCCSGSPCRSGPASARLPGCRGSAPWRPTSTSRTGSSTGCGRCRPGSPCRSSRSSRPACGSSAAASATAWPTRLPWVWSSRWCSGSWWGCSVAPGSSRGSPRPSSTTTSRGGTSSGLSLLAGIGFTVSLLVGELAFGAGSPRDEHVKLAVLVGSLVSAVLASVVLRARNRVYRRLWELESRDDDGDGIPDCFEVPVGRRPSPPGAHRPRSRMWSTPDAVRVGKPAPRTLRKRR